MEDIVPGPEDEDSCTGKQEEKCRQQCQTPGKLFPTS